MGKASRILNEERNKIYTENIETDFPHIDNNKNNQKYNNEKKLHKVALEIKKEMINFCQNESYPLCEYLEIENVEVLLKYILNN
jgi:hypothetical protein